MIFGRLRGLCIRCLWLQGHPHHSALTSTLYGWSSLTASRLGWTCQGLTVQNVSLLHYLEGLLIKLCGEVSAVPSPQLEFKWEILAARAWISGSKPSPLVEEEGPAPFLIAHIAKLRIKLDNLRGQKGKKLKRFKKWREISWELGY